MIKVEEFTSLEYRQQKEYLVDLLDSLPVQFATSKSISKLLKNHSPSSSFLLSIFDQITKMEQDGVNNISIEEKTNIDKYSHIVANYDGLTKKDQQDAEAYLIKELNNL